MTALFCQMCGASLVPGAEIPAVCPWCGLMTIWATTEPTMTKVPEPNVAYLITSNDRQFLFRIRIACE